MRAAPTRHDAVTVAAQDALTRLESSGLIQRDETGVRTTRRWQGAMARAATKLLELEGPAGGSEDLRIPITVALLEIYGRDVDEDELVRAVEAMLPVELRSLGLLP